MRCDVNVSVRKVGETEFRTRNEMKNVNSVKFVMQAIESEAKRHVETYENGGVIEQETRQFDPSTGTTKVMRKKEFAHDYRYFPEPDLLPLVLTDEFVEQIRGEMVELPDAKKDRFVKELGLTAYDASVICENKESADKVNDFIAVNSLFNEGETITDPVARWGKSYTDEERVYNAVRAYIQEGGEDVKVYTIGRDVNNDWFSKEVCGGPHVQHTAQIGDFKIEKEQSSSAGVRRIRATISGGLPLDK